METKQFLEEKAKVINWQLTLKVVTIGFIALVLMIPRVMIEELVRERESSAESAKHEVMQKWSLNQILRGPVLTIPYIEKTYDDKGKILKEEVHEYHFLPENLDIEGEIIPKELHRSIYQSEVYESLLKISGYFEIPDFKKLKLDYPDILWERAVLSVAISDLRGINTMVDLLWNGERYAFSPGMNNQLLGDKGISISLPHPGTSSFPANFQINLNIKGSDELRFAPLGEITRVNLRSSWNDPGFQGNFLPEKRVVSSDGFSAEWKILNFNRNFPQVWKDGAFNVTGADFGVRLVSVADHYQKSLRSAKYGILVVLFVFLSFFLNEMITKQRIHSFQYILVGFAVLIFYLLLLSISEHLGFNMAYLISSFAVTGMVLAYSGSFLKTWSASVLLSSILAFSFGFIFVLMQLESYALLAGSVGLFCVLGLTMFFTRKINWYSE
ncbi:MAG: cell envelope integrity protein CreD [Prolixibacteraceae bacterium]|jgi:inner membrane protein|nr:cell envelope integrity protein CreD [Prolixibacteraceae bacterium]